MIVEMKLTLDQVRELLQMPSINCIGIERQLRLVENWMDEKHTGTSYADPVAQLVILLPLVDLESMSDDGFCHFMIENNVIMQNHECKIMQNHVLYSPHELTSIIAKISVGLSDRVWRLL